MVKKLFDIAHKIGVTGLISMTSASGVSRTMPPSPRAHALHRIASHRISSLCIASFRAPPPRASVAAARRFFGVYTIGDGMLHMYRHRVKEAERMKQEGIAAPPPPTLKGKMYFS